MRILTILIISFLVILLQSGCEKKKEDKPPQKKPKTTKIIISKNKTKKESKKVVIYTGRYSYGYIKKIENDSRGFIDIKKAKEGFKFELELDGGEPDYQMGELSGKIKIKDNKSKFRDKFYKKCEITFEFNKNLLKITQKGSSGECGFGMGVFATGEYYKEK